MPSNNFPNVGKITYGRDFNYYQKATIVATNFGDQTVDGYQPDMVITFPTYTVTFQLESGGPLQYSFNGNTVHGDMIIGKPSQSLVFQDRDRKSTRLNSSH